MTQIKAKQVQGAVDNDSKQPISGEKTFKDKAVFEDKSGKYHVVIEGGFIYWLGNPDKLEEKGNIRLGVVGGKLSEQKFQGGRWQENKTKKIKK